MKNRILLLFLTVFLVSCGITDFEMPSWDVELTSIPLMNEDFPASDLEGENIIIENGELIAVVEDQLEETTPELSKNIVDSTLDLPLASNEQAMIRFEIQSINSNTSFRIIEGTFESGEMLLTFTGDVNNFTELQLTFAQLLTEDDSVLIEKVQPEDFNDNVYIIDLAGMKLTEQDIDGEFWLIDILVYATSDATTGSNIGQTRLSINDELVFRSFIGFIDDVRTLDSEANVEIDYPSNVENAIILDEISMYFDIYNKIGFEFELMGDLLAYRDGVVIDSLSIEKIGEDFTIQASTVEGEETITTINIEDNQWINQMLRLMPDKMSFLNPTYKVNNLDGDNPGFVSNQHTIRSEYRIKIPLKATFNDDYLIYPDNVYEVEISKDNQDLIDDRVNSATINLELINEFPIGGVLDLFVSSEELAADSLSLEQAELQYIGYSIEVSSDVQTYELELSKNDLDIFLRDLVFMRTRVRFYNSDGVVAILADDNLNVKGLLKMSLKIEGN
jgi:hypothetical protein